MRPLACTAIVALLVVAAASQAAPPRIQSAAEGHAIETIQELALDPATPPPKLEQALAAFVRNYPKSEFQAVVQLETFRFYLLPARFDLAALERHGAALLALDPDNLFALMTLGPALARTTAPDPEPDFQLAAGYDQHVLALCDRLDVSPGQTLTVDGRRLDYDQVNELRDGAVGGAQSSLGRIALRRKQYAAAVAAYQTALLYEIQPQKSVDNYYLALAQEGLGQYDRAEASLAAALNGNSRSPALTQAVAREQARIQLLRGH